MISAKVIAIVIASVVWIMGAFQSPTPSPQSSLTPSALPTSTPTPIAVTTPSNNWKYPGPTTDSPQVITDWYKNKIKALGMNTTSFVQTTTNGNVLNKLIAASASQKVSVEISKSAVANQTTIIVELDN